MAQIEMAHRNQWAVVEGQLVYRTMQPGSKSTSSLNTSKINNNIQVEALHLIAQEVDLGILPKHRVSGDSQIFSEIKMARKLTISTQNIRECIVITPMLEQVVWEEAWELLKVEVQQEVLQL